MALSYPRALSRSSKRIGAVIAFGFCALALIFNPSAPPLFAASTTTNGKQLTLSASALTFPKQLVGTTSPAMVLTATNTGSGIIKGLTVGINASEFVQTNNCPSTLSKGDVCNISVTFSPDFSLQFGATLTVSTANGTPQTVSLSGLGYALQSLTVTPVNPWVQSHFSIQFTATGSYTDASTQDLTNVVTWTSSDSTHAASITPTGLATGFGGDATITASLGNISNSTILHVLILNSLQLSPVNPTILPGQTQQFTVKGNYSDGSTRDYPGVVSNWFSSAPAVASVTQTGLASAVSFGTTTINAMANGQYVSTTLYVSYSTPTGNMVSAINYPRANVLLDRRVLVNGDNTIPQAFTISTGTFTNAASTTGFGDRYLQTSNLLDDGRVLVTGGTSTSTVGVPTLNTALIFDPANQSFSATGSMSTSRVMHRATRLQDGRILVTGGRSLLQLGNGGVVLASAETYDQTTGVFSSQPSMAHARAQHTSTLLNSGLVLVTGGYDGTASLATAELYDPATNTFVPTGNMSIPRSQHTATLMNDGRVLIAGGVNFGVTVLNSMEIYDPSTGTFSSQGGAGQTLFTQVFDHTSTLLSNGMVLIAGGSTYGSPIWSSTSSFEVFDPVLNHFVAAGNLQTPRSGQSATRLNDGRVLIAGGYQQTALNSAEIFQPDTFTPAGLVSITVSAPNSSVAAGATEAFVATGHFSDGSTQVLSSVTWSSSNTGIASVTSDETNSGVARGIATGSANITATAGSVSGWMTLTVTP